MELDRVRQSPTRLPKSRRADPAQLGPFSLGESHKRMLRILYEHRYLTAPLLALAYSQDRGRGRSHVENELGRLYHREYVERHYYATRPAGAGSDEYVYAITPKGAHAILDRETYSAERFAIYNRVKRKDNYKHHLAVSTLQVILELGVGPWTLEEFYADDDEATRFEATVGRRRRTHYPDALAVIRYPNRKRAGFLFELDVAHKASQRLRDRFEAYREQLTTNWEDFAFAHKISGAVAVFVASNEHELGRLVDAAQDALADSNREVRRGFLFWNLESWYETPGTSRGLKDPRRILAAENAASIAGSKRRLIGA